MNSEVSLKRAQKPFLDGFRSGPKSFFYVGQEVSAGRIQRHISNRIRRFQKSLLKRSRILLSMGPEASSGRVQKHFQDKFRSLFFFGWIQKPQLHGSRDVFRTGSEVSLESVLESLQDKSRSLFRAGSEASSKRAYKYFVDRSRSNFLMGSQAFSEGNYVRPMPFFLEITIIKK